MGDGSYHFGGVVLNVQELGWDLALLLKYMLDHKLGTDSTMWPERGQPLIYIRAHFVRALTPQLLPLMSRDMLYKLGL